MTEVSNFDRELITLLPETYRLLKGANLVVHPSVSRITLHGTRGLLRGYRDDSDLDLCLTAETNRSLSRVQLGSSLREVFETTLNHWQGDVELDHSVAFDTMTCGLKCFDRRDFDERVCQKRRTGCLGIYKIGKGFDGFVPGEFVEVKTMYPCLLIWRSENSLTVQNPD